MIGAALLNTSACYASLSNISNNLSSFRNLANVVALKYVLHYDPPYYLYVFSTISHNSLIPLIFLSSIYDLINDIANLTSAHSHS